MRKITLMNRRQWIGAAVLALAGGLGAYHLVFASGGRAECPGKIICPITGEEICKDQCPLVAADRPDCPGKIECPLTDQPVCRDRCPVSKDRAKTDKAPSCCQKPKQGS